MAKSGTITGTQTGSRPYLQLKWSTTSQSVAGNTSRVNMKLYLISPYQINIGARSGVLYGSSFSTTATSGSNINKLISEKNFTISHNSDGKKSVSVSARFDIQVTWSGTYVGSISLSGTINLDTIPRASSFSLSGGTTTGSAVSVSISRASSSFTHAVRYRIGSGSWRSVATAASTSASFTLAHTDVAEGSSATITVGVQTKSGSSNIGSEVTSTRAIKGPSRSTFSTSGANTGSATTVTISRQYTAFTHVVRYKVGSGSWIAVSNSAATSATFTVPHSAIPNDVKATITVGVQTKSGSSNIGSERTATFQINVPTSVIPTISAMTVSEYTSAVLNLGLGTHKYVQHKSRLNIAISSASGASGSTIKSYRMTVDGQVSNAQSGTTGFLNSHGNLKVIGTVTDSRNRTSKAFEVSITVMPYQIPVVSDIVLYRSDSGGNIESSGEHVQLKVKPKITSLDSKNSATLTIKSKKIGSSYANRDTNLPFSSQISKIYAGFGTTDEYQFMLVVTDKLHTTETETDSLFVQTAEENFFVGYRGVASSFGKLPTHGNKYNLEVGGKGMRVDGPIITDNGGEVSGHKSAEYTNFNNYIKDGTYQFPQTAGANSTPNAPAVGAGRLLVMNNGKNGEALNIAYRYLTQMYISIKNDVMIRSYSSNAEGVGTWTSWKRIA